jgi:hypothetical protein
MMVIEEIAVDDDVFDVVVSDLRSSVAAHRGRSQQGKRLSTSLRAQRFAASILTIALLLLGVEPGVEPGVTERQPAAQMETLAGGALAMHSAQHDWTAAAQLIAQRTPPTASHAGNHARGLACPAVLEVNKGAHCGPLARLLAISDSVP